MVTTVRYRRRRQSSNGRADATPARYLLNLTLVPWLATWRQKPRDCYDLNALVSGLEWSAPSCPTRRNASQKAFGTPE
jgi:hypothetical protein